ncbi:MAG: hypothetical protein Q8R02_18015 [Hyphomonadaceae bacterium]|nr:hypothetical protein [Hyphomonadaceae bacterium]
MQSGARSVGVAGALLVAAGIFASAALAQDAPRTSYPRDFTGVWTNANLTPVSRPRGVDRLEVSPEEARRMAATSGVLGFAREESNYVDRIDPNAPAPPKGSSDFGVKGYNSFWLATGDSLARVKGTYRTSNIIDPPNGQIPYSPTRPRPSRPRGGNFITGAGLYDGPEYLGIAERCLMAFSGASGPGMFTPIYNNNYQFVLTDDYLVIHVEMVHDARIIPIYANAAEARAHHKPGVIKPWMGDSVAWWEDDVLVAESVNLHPIQADQGQIPLSPKGKITERFQRWADDEIFYSFTVDDPETYAQTWTVENSFRPQSRVYEYACHEGNYAMPGILIGARKLEREQATAKAGKTKD